MYVEQLLNAKLISRRLMPLFIVPDSESNMMVETWCHIRLQLNNEAFIHSFISEIFEQLVHI